jgi:tetratricopeptide (TPR) repeat protein
MPQSLAPYQNLAQVYLQDSRTNDALRVLDEAAQQSTDDANFLIDLADIYLRYEKGRAGQAESINKRVVKLLDRAADLGVSNPMQMLRVADDYFNLGELKKAEPFYRQLIDEHPDLATLRGKLTEIYLRSGQKEKASQQLEALAQNEPTNPQAYVFLGALAAEEKKFPEAAEHFERALKLDPDLEQVYYDLAGLKLTLKKPEEALEVLNKARARFKLNFPIEFYSGIAYAALKVPRYSDALNAMTSAEAIARATEPSRLNHLFYFQVASTYERAGRLPEAEQYFQQCLKLAPDDAEALNYLGYMWAEHDMKLEEARKLIEQAVKLEPSNPAFLDSLAWVLFKLHKSQEALAPMLKAIEHSDEPDPTLYDHLGDIYTGVNQPERAREAWGKALKIQPNPQIQQKFDAAGISQPSH